jgi:uncharacterized protein YjgD (DUF1641 family)
MGTMIGISPREELMARLDDPKTAEALNRLLDRLDLMVLAADGADEFLRRGDVIADSVSEGFAELRQVPISSDARSLADKLPDLAHAGLQVADLAGSPAFARLMSSGLIERLGEAKTIESLHSLLDHLDLASFALKSADEFLERSEVIIESVAESVSEITKTESPINFAKIKELMEALPMLFDLALQVKRSGLLEKASGLIESFSQLQNAGIFEPQTVAVVGELGSAATAAHDKKQYATYSPKGIFGLLGALRDPEVQATLGFVIAVAHNYGRTLKSEAK